MRQEEEVVGDSLGTAEESTGVGRAVASGPSDVRSGYIGKPHQRETIFDSQDLH